MMLVVRGLSVDYGRVRALDQIDLEVGEGEIVTLIGANGAGKSTLLKAIVGLVRPASGDITFAGQALAGIPTHARAKRGLILVPEGRGVLTRMTVLENLQLGADVREGATTPIGRVRAMLTRFPALAARRDLPAGVLSGGEQQMLAFARALLAQPRLLLIDEPSLGLAPRITQEVFHLLLNVRREGITVLLVEQN